MYKKNLTPTAQFIRKLAPKEASVSDLLRPSFHQLGDSQWDKKAKYHYRLLLTFEKSWCDLWSNLIIECPTYQIDPCDPPFEKGNDKGRLIRIDVSEGQLLYITSELRRLCMILLFRYAEIKEPQLAIYYDESVKQAVDAKLLRKKQEEEEEWKEKKEAKKERRQKEEKRIREIIKKTEQELLCERQEGKEEAERIREIIERAVEAVRQKENPKATA